MFDPYQRSPHPHVTRGPHRSAAHTTTSILQPTYPALTPYEPTSTTRQSEKEVVLLTQVMTSSEQLQCPFEPRTIKYLRGGRLHQLTPPTPQVPFSGGLVIQMPLEEIEAYLSTVLQLDSLACDEQLVDYLN